VLASGKVPMVSAFLGRLRRLAAVACLIGSLKFKDARRHKMTVALHLDVAANHRRPNHRHRKERDG
jgi:hypothetical protein